MTNMIIGFILGMGVTIGALAFVAIMGSSMGAGSTLPPRGRRRG